MPGNCDAVSLNLDPIAQDLVMSNLVAVWVAGVQAGGMGQQDGLVPAQPDGGCMAVQG
jgi:hypothetical protein